MKNKIIVATAVAGFLYTEFKKFEIVYNQNTKLKRLERENLALKDYITINNFDIDYLKETLKEIKVKKHFKTNKKKKGQH